MSGNRKHGFRRGNRGGFRPERWYCHGCAAYHRAGVFRNGTRDGRSLCDRRYNAEARAAFMADRELAGPEATA